MAQSNPLTVQHLSMRVSTVGEEHQDIVTHVTMTGLSVFL